MSKLEKIANAIVESDAMRVAGRVSFATVGRLFFDEKERREMKEFMDQERDAKRAKKRS
jgi:hypothetical protein